MRKFVINVNGNSYEVEVEEVTEGGAVISSPVPRVQAPAAAAPKAASAKPAASAPKKAAPAGAVAVSAPMPGTILDIKVSEGQAVKKGDILMILEAMKMENEIVAPQDGTVAAIQVDKGASVNTGDALVSLA